MKERKPLKVINKQNIKKYSDALKIIPYFSVIKMNLNTLYVLLALQKHNLLYGDLLVTI